MALLRPGMRFLIPLQQAPTEMFAMEHDGFVFLVSDVSVIRVDRRKVAR